MTPTNPGGGVPRAAPQPVVSDRHGVSDRDYAGWLTKQQAAEAIGVTTKTVERLAVGGQVQHARWRRPTGGPAVVVYHPADIERIASARRPGRPVPFLVPGTAEAGHRHDDGPSEALVPAAREGVPGDDLLRALVAAALRAVSETSETPTLFVTVAEASALSGLSQSYLRRAILEGTLPAIRDRGWRIRRRDLEAL